MISRIGNRTRNAISRKQPFNQRGLTLIEVLTAVSILAIGIIGVLQAYAGSITTLEVGQFNINAINVLKSQMNAIEEMVLTEESPNTSGRGEEGDFRWEWDLSSTGTENLKKLTLTVSSELNPRTFTLNSYVVEKEEEEI